MGYVTCALVNKVIAGHVLSFFRVSVKSQNLDIALNDC